MDTIRRRKYKNRSTSAFWHIDSTCKLVSHTSNDNSALDGHIRCIMQLKVSNNNKGVTAHKLFKETITNHVTPLRARGDKG